MRPRIAALSRPALVALGLAALLAGPAIPALAGSPPGLPLPLPSPSLPPLPLPPPPSPVALPPPPLPPLPVPAPPLPAVPLPLGSPAPGPGPGAQPAPAGDPAPDAPAPAGFAPPPDERAALPDEPQRFAMEGQQYDLAQGLGTLDDGQTDYNALGAGGGQGGFAWPFALRRRPPVTQPFGCTAVPGEPYSPACATHRFHTGVDLGVPTGTPVLASRAGVARTFRSSGGYGNYVLLVHGDGWYTLYAHLSRILVSDGQVVGPRQEVGESGSTGFSTGPHLHFEVRHGPDYVDPCLYLGC